MKFDYYAQLVFCIILAIGGTMALIPGMGGSSLLALFGLIPLGIWQLISAGVNTYRFREHTEKIKHLKRYWIASAACLALFFGSFVFKNSNGHNDIMVVTLTTSITCSALVAIYYLYLLKKVLLNHDVSVAVDVADDSLLGETTPL